MRSRDEYLRLGDVRLRYRDEGTGPPVVFIHGWTLDLEAWAPQAAALASSQRVIRYDRRGFGLSEGEPGRAADGTDLRCLLDHLGLPTASLVGQSQGARVALAFALSHPERTAALVLDGPPDEIGEAGTGDEDFSMAAFRRLAREQGVDAFRRAWRAHPLMRLHTGDPGMRALVDSMLERYPARDLVAGAEPPPAPAGVGALAAYGGPVLVVNGELDTFVRHRAGESLAQALPRANRAVIPGAGHLPNVDAPHAYNGAVQAFLSRLTRSAA